MVVPPPAPWATAAQSRWTVAPMPSPRLAGHENGPDASPTQIDLLLGRHLAQSQGIGRRTAEDSDAIFQNGSQAGQAAHSPSGNAKAPPSCSGLEGGPEPQKGTERKSKKQPVPRGDPSCLEDSVPIVEHPLPAFRRIQPVHWLASGGAGAAEPGVAVQVVGQIGAVGRVTALILDQFRLLGEGHGRPKGIQGWNLRRQSRLFQPGGIEGIAGPQRRQEVP